MTPTKAKGRKSDTIKVGRKRPPHPGEEARIAERDRQVFTLARVGWSCRRIAAQLGCSKSTVAETIRREIHERRTLTAMDADDLRTMDIERCKAIMSAMWPKAQAGGEKAGLTYLAAMKRHAALLGLDMPTKIAPTTPDGLKPYDDAKQRLFDKVADLVRRHDPAGVSGGTDGR